ncbi:MAG: GTP-binding protein, partial [Paenibacillaceae bacterium]|nr:GTP-binding protein [Paenibacillaceae bacterium]
MELLIAAMLMLWGNVTDGNPQVTLDQIAQIAELPPAAIVMQPDGTKTVDPLVPAGKADPQAGAAPVVKGVYATAHSAGGARLETLLKLLDETELNALVID